MNHSHSHDFQTEHDVKSDCCICCNNTPRSTLIAELDQYYQKAQTNGYYYGLLTPAIYEATKLEINKYYDDLPSAPETKNKYQIYLPALFSTLYRIDLSEGSSVLRYSS